MKLKCVAAVAAAAWAIAAGAQAKTVAVAADRLLDVATGKYVEKPLVIVTDERVSAIEHQGDAVPAGAERVDLPGVTLLPGLIDMHVHLTGDPHYSGYRRLEFTDNFWTVVGVVNARKTVEAQQHQARQLSRPHRPS